MTISAKASADGTELTITASETGDLPDSIGFPSPTITPGT